MLQCAILKLINYPNTKSILGLLDSNLTLISDILGIQSGLKVALLGKFLNTLNAFKCSNLLDLWLHQHSVPTSSKYAHLSRLFNTCDTSCMGGIFKGRLCLLIQKSSSQMLLTGKENGNVSIFKSC